MPWYSPGMKATIDSAGRMVLPKRLREAVGLGPGEVEVSVDGAALRVEAIAGDELVEEAGRLVLPARGEPVDADLVREARFADQR